MKTGGMGGFRRHEAETAHQLRTGDDAEEQAIAAEALTFARGEDGGDDHRTGVHRTAFEGVVEVLTVGRCPIDEGRAERVESAAVAEGAAGAAVVNTCARCGNVVGAAR